MDGCTRSLALTSSALSARTSLYDETCKPGDDQQTMYLKVILGLYWGYIGAILRSY